MRRPERKLNKQGKEKRREGTKDAASGIKSTRQLQGKNIINSFETVLLSTEAFSTHDGKSNFQ